MTYRAQRVTAGVLGAVLLVAFGLLLYRATNPTTGDYEVRVALKDADGLRKDSLVKIDGVRAGVVKSLKVERLAAGGQVARAVLRLDDDAGAIGRGATAKARPVNLLGEKFLDLRPGDLRDPQPSGVQIPVSRTGASVGLDDALNTLDPDTRTRIGILINESGVGLQGRADKFRDILQVLPDSLGEAKTALQEVTMQDQTLRRLITNTDRVLEPTVSRRDDLSGLIAEGNRTLGIVARQDEALKATLRTAPAGLQQLRQTVGELGATARDLVPAARNLRVAAPPLAATLRSVPDFADAARGALREAKTAAPTVTRLATRATPTVRRLRPTLANTDKLLASTRTVVDDLANKNGLKTLLYFMQTWARTIRERDGLGHEFGAMATLDPGLFTSVIDQLSQTNADVNRAGRKARKSAPVARPHDTTPAAPAAQESKPLALPKLPAVVTQIPKTLDKTLKSIVGPIGAGGGEAPAAPTSAKAILNNLLGR